MMRWFLAYAFYPLSLLSAVSAGLLLPGEGVAPAVAVSCIRVFFIALCFTLKLRFQQYPDWHCEGQELREHPVQSFITYGLRLSALWLLGASVEVLALYSILAGAGTPGQSGC